MNKIQNSANKAGEVLIRKASGELEPFIPEKLKRSLMRVRAPELLADEIVEKIRGEVKNGDSTYFIYSYALSLLRGKEKRFTREVKKEMAGPAGRYSLKKAIMELGPTGHPFETIVAELLRLEGFDTKTRQIIRGICVNHEVDVVAEKGNERMFVECKFHNQFGAKTDVKDTLYIKARFDDIENMFKRQGAGKIKKDKMWVVTNTKLTSEAIDYSKCVGLEALGWNYPKGNGLEAKIDKAGLHPLTSLSTLSQVQKQNLLKEDIVLCKDVLRGEKQLRATGMNDSKIETVKREIAQICEI